MHRHDAHQEPHDELTRRTFLKALGASLALAGLDGCTRLPAEKILPYVNQPPELTPGIPLHYATSMVLDGFATGLIVEAHEGRPTKIEGNPEHPASLGAAGLLEQASLLQLYDPDRATHLRNGSAPSSWQAFVTAFSPAALRQRVGARGERLALLLEPTSSPLIASRVDVLRTLYPAMRVFVDAPLGATGMDGAFTATGVIPQYDFRAADVILSVGSNFLAAGPFNLRYARDFSDRRRSPASGMNRLYVAESDFSVTGGAADHRVPLAPGALESMLAEVLNAVRGGGGASPWSAAVAQDLMAHTGRGVVITGENQSARVHAFAAAINDALSNTGRTVWFTRSPLLGGTDTSTSVNALSEAIAGGQIDTLVCLGGNPSYSTPGAVGFSASMRRVPNSAYLGAYENETARDARWFVPAAHYLETWGDALAYDGTYSLVQPLVQPLHGGKSVVELLSVLAGEPLPDVREAVRKVATTHGVAAGDTAWTGALGRGFVAGQTLARVTVTPRPDLLSPPTAVAQPDGAITVAFAYDTRVHDGSFANNGWLQELPDPMTKATWDNAALIAPATARRLGITTGDVLDISNGNVAVRIPALLVPGHAIDTLTLPLGYGRAGAERVARGVGVDVNPLRPANGSSILGGVAVKRTGERHEFAVTQGHWTMEGRGQARTLSLAELSRGAPVSDRRARRTLTIYDPPSAPRLDAPQQWAMTIDLGTCIGCSACVVACQAENNIPVVGRDDVANSREMHWLRIDRYVEGPEENPRTITQPMLCQQCENAPCEYVCPVGATTHSSDGLNEMVYNRCVGTRFCSNNCPYKVRRFNWIDYNAGLSDTEQMGKNPDVTVRERGVMEKCTFCVQRIREAEIAARVDGRPLRGSEVKTACQQSCPTNAIVFGSLTERDSDVARQRGDQRAYTVLDELDTHPRVTYLARVRNANSSLEPHG